MTAVEMRRAAKLLRIDARAIKDSHQIGGRWVYLDNDDEYVKDEHDEMLDLARKLEALAKEM